MARQLISFCPYSPTPTAEIAQPPPPPMPPHAGRIEGPVHESARRRTSAEIGAVPSIGTVGKSCDNALAETVNGYYKAELIREPARPALSAPSTMWSSRPAAGCTDTTTSGFLVDLPPAEFEGKPYATQRVDQALVEIK